jgi:Arc/MetJ-type ribon-helix-helix transcriptional regulator
MTKESIGVYAGSKIPHTIKKALQEAITDGNYLNYSDFIRDAIKEKLQREGFIPIKKE